MAYAEMATRTDPAGPNGWSISDELTQLREWGTGIAYPLPTSRGSSILGAAQDCWLRLWDPTGRISRRHATLTCGDAGWTISDLDSKNGIHLDGVRVAASSLVPGAEIRIGPVTLIAESPKLIALRTALERLIGWGEDRREEVDQALFSIRVATTHREPLLLCGAGNLVPIARLLHQHALGDRPFIVSKPRTAHARGMDALAAATGGTLCVWRNQQPADFDDVVSALRGPVGCALLIICAHALPRGNDIASQVVTVVRSLLIPPLADRANELHRIVDEYAGEAIAAFGGGWMAPADREWVATNAIGSLQQLGMATRRIVALHACGESVTQAAKLLGMSHGSLSDWLARRTLPGRSAMPYEEDDDSEGDATGEQSS
jgi:Inner membrane component of T3SS, cytoplasmic domain